MNKDELKEEFAIRLRDAMGRESMNIQTLAEKCDIGKETICKYLDSQSPNFPTMYTLYKLCMVLKVSADYFLFGGPYDGRQKGIKGI